MMMHLTMPALTLALALVALPASAQTGEDGCTEAAPCPWSLFVDETGFYLSEPDYNGTAGDWISITVANDDPDAVHTVTLADYGLSWELEPFADAQSGPFMLVTGESVATDDPTGDTAVLRVTEGDPLVEQEQQATETTGEERDIPGPALPIVVLSVLAVLAVAPTRRA